MRKFTSLVLILLLLSFFLSTLNVGIVNAEPKTIVVPDEYPTIQEAVDAASEGDTVFVKSGTYNESVFINQAISLVGEEPATTTIIGDWRLNGTVVLIRHNNVKIKGFTIQPSAYSFSRKGVHLLHVNHCNVVGNIILNNGYGVWLYGASENNITENTVDCQGNRSTGIFVDYSPNNLIVKNTVINNYSGIALLNSAHENTVCNNTVIDNHAVGLNIASNNNNITGNVVNNQVTGVILNGLNNVLRGNKINNSTILSFDLNWNIGFSVFDFVNDVDSSNLINGKSIIYWVNKQNEKVPEESQFVILVNCKNIIVENLMLTKDGQGIILVDTTDSIIQNNTVQFLNEGIVIFESANNKIIGNTLLDCGYGFYLVSSFQNVVSSNLINGGGRAIKLDSSNENVISSNVILGNLYRGFDFDGSNNNEIFENTVSNCERSAVWFWNYPSHNVFYLNNFVNNTENVEKYITDLQEFPANIWDNGTVGNFWDDYHGIDDNDDGIGDTSYIIDENNQDNYPLTEPYVIPEFPSWTILPLLIVVTLVCVTIRNKLRKKG